MVQGELLGRRELELRGVVRPDRRTGLVRERRNVYRRATEAPGSPEEAYIGRLRAAHRTLTGDRIYSHESAAALLGVPVLGRWPAAVHLICDRRSGGRSQLDVVRHCVGLEDVDPIGVDGFLVTSPARTIFDIALARRFTAAVVVADGTLARYPDARAELAALVDGYGRRRGHRALAAVQAFADGRSGSVGESVSRVQIDRLGFATPDLQVPITTDGRTEFGDFGWEQVGGLGEFDGEVKYRDDRYRLGGSIADVMIREKNRENRLRLQRPRFARWDWDDIQRRLLEGILLAAGIPKRYR